jgi:hypothetical protein
MKMDMTEYKSEIQQVIPQVWIYTFEARNKID